MSRRAESRRVLKFIESIKIGEFNLFCKRNDIPFIFDSYLMKMKKSIINLFTILYCVTAFSQSPATYVNPFIGTGGHGHTFPGATVPFGMVQLSPDTRIDGSWDGCSGYHYSDDKIYGFSHTHLSGTGCSDYGDIAILPFTAYQANDKKNRDAFDYKKYAAHFSHTKEKASAGFYEVLLDNQVQVQLTATTRVGIHRYLFPKDKEAHLVIQADHRDKTLQSEMKLVDTRTIEGFRRSEAWAKDQYIYYVIEFSSDFMNEGTKLSDGNVMFQCLGFPNLNERTLLVKVGISNVSIEGARKNLREEAVSVDFNGFKQQAEDRWNDELNKIKVYSKNKERLTVFYTALYHTMIQPNIAMDVDGSYRGRDNQIHQAKGFTYYSVFSLWDTFRATHPLNTIIDQKRTADFINTFIAQYEQCGRIPMWELSGNETDCMIGFHGVSVIADAYLKNITGFDAEKAYQAMVAASNYTAFGIPAFNQQYYLQVDDEPESVSKTLEYAYDNWCIAQMAGKMRKGEDRAIFLKRAQAYKNVFDPSTRFMRPRKNGDWLNPFDPSEVNNHFTEANSWQYSFFVPHDIEGLIQLMGGEKAFEKKLDDLFAAPSKTNGREQADITGLIGQYAHGNEPSHHMAYLYNEVAKPEKTQEKVSYILKEFYKNSPDGLIGNEDCGQMSAWYVFSAMGFYPVCPGSSIYQIGNPIFDSVVISMGNDKVVHLSTQLKSGSEAHYVASTTINGKEKWNSFLPHQLLENGSRIVFNMVSEPDTSYHFGKRIQNFSHQKVRRSLVRTPIIHSQQRVFLDQAEISIESLGPGSELYYTLDGTMPSRFSTKYTKPFKINQTTTIQARAYSTKDSSSIVSSTIYKKPNTWSVQLHSQYNKQYTAGGDEGLIDGIKGSTNWRKGDWQGYQSQDFECVIDLGKEQKITYCSAHFLQDSRAWILYPVKVEYYLSDNGKDFTLTEVLENKIGPDSMEVQIQNFEKYLAKPLKARYVKIKAYNYGKLPQWHQGYGGDAFIFVDEIEIK